MRDRGGVCTRKRLRSGMYLICNFGYESGVEMIKAQGSFASICHTYIFCSFGYSV